MKHAPLVAVLVGCTSLGPMPATTGVSAIPAGRPGGEVSAGLAPIFRLSDAADGDDRNGKSNPEVAALFDPDRLLGLPGLFVRARVWGKDGDSSLEPALGYRRRLDDRISLGGVAYGTKMKDDDNGASYKATRFGAEGMVDIKIADIGGWTQLHAQGAVQATYMKASGRYCVETATGNARDCAEDGSIPMIDGALSGVFPAGTLQLAVDVGRRPSGWFHHARIAGMIAAGWMPRVVNGDQRSGDPYVTGGLALTFAFGAAD
jgi:hypothetical protein